MFKIYLCTVFFISVNHYCISQDIALGNKIIDGHARSKGLTNSRYFDLGFNLRFSESSPEWLFFDSVSIPISIKRFQYKFLPIYSVISTDSERPYNMGEFEAIPSRGFQSFISSGFKANISFIHLQFQPEFVWSENKSFDGFPNSFSYDVNLSRFYFWNLGDSPERFGNNIYRRFSLGQSFLSFRYKSFELGTGTRNFWWGPGQWNSLIFSNNAPGFPNISLNTSKPAKTFIGSFEGQIIIGRLESSGFNATQKEDLNYKFFIPLNPNWRYLNGLMVSYNPKFLPGFSLGYSRTYQYYSNDRPKDLKGWLPILEPMAKEKFFRNGNSSLYDSRRQSQQIGIFSRYKFFNAKTDIYFQFGRRDHAFNWREFLLNPEHARAYQFGFVKLVSLPFKFSFLQFKGEITHQQESINRNLRYDILGGSSWHTHSPIRGFTNYGQPMGVGIGTGSNVQTLEISLIKDWKKWGILFERLENHQDFYYRAFGRQSERMPWIDWSTALLWNSSWRDLFITAKIQGVYARNYQWGLAQNSNPEFPVSHNLFSLHSQINLIYFWNRSLKNGD